MKLFIVDAFTSIPFSGNPAAVCVMDKWISDDLMKMVAMECNLSETAFVVNGEDGYSLRWFTPVEEVDLCGHATIAAAAVILRFFDPSANAVKFNTKSGVLTVKKTDNRYEMYLPRVKQHEVPVTDEMEKAFGARPVKALLGLDLVCVFENEEQVRKLTPNQKLLANLDGRIQNATARGVTAECVSRSFAPKLGIAEDPVCGSAHIQIAEYWAVELFDNEITAYQASKRGGFLTCKLVDDNKIAISGEAVLVMTSEVVANLDYFDREIEMY